MRVSTAIALSAIYTGNQVDACEELKTLWNSLKENDTEEDEVPYEIAETLRDLGSSSGCASVHCPFMASVASVIVEDGKGRIRDSLVNKADTLRRKLIDGDSGDAECSSEVIPSSVWKRHINDLEQSLAVGDVHTHSDVVESDLEAVLESMTTLTVSSAGAVISPHHGCEMEIGGHSIRVDSECQVLLCRTYHNVQAASGATRTILENGDDIVDNGAADEVEGDLYSVGVSLQSLVQDPSFISTCSGSSECSNLIRNLYGNSAILDDIVDNDDGDDSAKFVEVVEVIHGQAEQLMEQVISPPLFLS